MTKKEPNQTVLNFYFKNNYFNLLCFMKKILPILLSLFILSGNAWSQIDFKRLTMQLPNSTTTVGAVKIGDLTNDGLNDVLVGSAVTESDQDEFNLYLYVQKTDGSLADPVRINVAATYPNVYDIEIADMNNDHLNDIVVGYGGSIGIFYQLPTGGFSAMTKLDGIDCTYGIKIGDLNNDGLKDIVGYDDSSNFKIFYQNKTGGFTLTTIPSKTWYCTQVELADVNGDNLVDLIKIYGSQIEINYQQNGVDITNDSTLIINLHNKNSYLSGIAIGDLNKDGRNDIAVAYGGNSGQYNIYYQKPDGHMDTTNVKTGSTYDCPTPIRIADLNCDGDNEMIIGHSGWENISVYNKHGLADFNTYTLFPAMYYFNLYSMAVGDINNDHRPDIVTVGQNGKIDLFYNNSKPLTFDSYDHVVANFQMKRDTTDIQTVNYIPITDNAACKKNRSVKQLITGTYANENYSGDSLLIRHGTLCSSFTDTVTDLIYLHKTNIF
jgi:hypothetical protein